MSKLRNSVEKAYNTYYTASNLKIILKVVTLLILLHLGFFQKSASIRNPLPPFFTSSLRLRNFDGASQSNNTIIFSEAHIIPGSVKTHLHLIIHDISADEFNARLKIIFKSPLKCNKALLQHNPDFIKIVSASYCYPSELSCNEWEVFTGKLIFFKVEPIRKGDNEFEYTLTINYILKVSDNDKTGLFRVTDTKLNTTYLSTKLKHKYHERKFLPFFIDSAITTSVSLIVQIPENLEAVSNTAVLESIVVEKGTKVIFEETPQMLLDHLVITIGRIHKYEYVHEERLTLRIISLAQIEEYHVQILTTVLSQIRTFELYLKINFPLKQLTIFTQGTSLNCNFCGWGNVTLDIESKGNVSDPEYELAKTQCIAKMVASQWIGTLVSIRLFQATWADEVLTRYVFPGLLVESECSFIEQGDIHYSRFTRLRQYTKSLEKDILSPPRKVPTICDLECIVAKFGEPKRMAEAFNMLISWMGKQFFFNIFTHFLENNSSQVVNFEKLLLSIDYVAQSVSNPTDSQGQIGSVVVESCLREKGVPQIDVELGIKTNRNQQTDTFFFIKQSPLGVKEADLSTVYIVPIKLILVIKTETGISIHQFKQVIRTKFTTIRIGIEQHLIQGAYVSPGGFYYYYPGTLLSQIQNTDAETFLNYPEDTDLEGVISMLNISIEMKTIKLDQAIDFIDKIFQALTNRKDTDRFTTLGGIAVIKGAIEMFWLEKRHIENPENLAIYSSLEKKLYRKAALRFTYIQKQLAGYLNQDFKQYYKDVVCQKQLERDIIKILEVISKRSPRKKREKLKN